MRHDTAELELARASLRRKLDFIRGGLRNLGDMAGGDRHQFLSYLIEMAYIEASDMLRDMHADETNSPERVAA